MASGYQDRGVYCTLAPGQSASTIISTSSDPWALPGDKCGPVTWDSIPDFETLGGGITVGFAPSKSGYYGDCTNNTASVQVTVTRAQAWPNWQPGLDNWAEAHGVTQRTDIYGNSFLEWTYIDIGVLDPAPKLEIIDCETGKPLSEESKQVVGSVVDVKVVPAANPTCADATVRDATWEFPGSVVQDYERTLQYGRIHQVTQGPEVKFHWIGATDGALSVSALVNGTQAKTSQDVSVVAPSITSLIINPTPSPVVGHDYYPNFPKTDLWFAYYGNDLRATSADQEQGTGITWKFSVVTPNLPNASGEIGMMQLINDSTSHVVSSTGVVNYTTAYTGGQYWPDGGCLEYNASAHVNAGQTASWQDSDAPMEPLSKEYSAVTFSSRFADYFMYRPSGKDSIWVTLAVYHWGFRELAERTKFGWTGNGTATHDASYRLSSDLPTWSMPEPSAFYSQCGVQR